MQVQSSPFDWYFGAAFNFSFLGAPIGAVINKLDWIRANIRWQSFYQIRQEFYAI